MNSFIRRRMCLVGAARVFALLLTFKNILAEVPNGWETFKGAFFEIGVPPGFVARPIETNGQIDAVVLVNSKTGVEFMVFSPQWYGEAPFKRAGKGEKVESREVKKVGKVMLEDIAIAAVDGSYTRFVLSQTFMEHEDGPRTNKTFGLKLLKNDKGASRKLYADWKRTLTQFAD